MSEFRRVCVTAATLGYGTNSIFLLVIYTLKEATGPSDSEPETPSAVIDRVSLVLDAFDGPGRLTLAQIVRRTGLPRSSAHRMLERLVQLRWLRRNGRDYELGMRLVELGSLAVHQDRLHRAAIPLLHDLHRATGLVVHLAVLDGPMWCTWRRSATA